jgi:gamma-glutamylaminecyclotransferase
VTNPTHEHAVFVYGTLKQGFRNFHVNHGQRVPGEFVTVQPHALLIVGEYWLPWLLQTDTDPGEGQPVIGQLYTVDDAGLAAMDKLEQIDEAGWYERRRIAVRARHDAQAAVLQPWVYFGSREGLAAGGQRLGPVAEFTLAHQDLLPREQWPLG